MTNPDLERRYYIGEIEKELERDRSTIRTWESKKWLPEGCEFKRDEKDWRYWTAEQLEIVREWMTSRNPGRVEHGLRRAEQQ